MGDPLPYLDLIGEQFIVEIPVILSQVVTIFYICAVAAYALKRDLIIILVAVELMLLAAILNFAFAAVLFQSTLIEVFILYILVIAAAESSIVLAIFVIYYNLGAIDGGADGEVKVKVRS